VMSRVGNPWEDAESQEGPATISTGGGTR
jgi:hypothetical protein